MPTVTIPLQSWKTYPELRKSKKFQKLAVEQVALARKKKEVELREAELKLDLYDLLKEALPDEVKSVEFEGVQFTRVDGGESRSLKKEKLLTHPIVCQNPKCRTENCITVDDLEACCEVTKKKPTVRVETIKSKGKD